jgi:hypothetical protein
LARLPWCKESIHNIDAGDASANFAQAILFGGKGQVNVIAFLGNPHGPRIRKQNESIMTIQYTSERCPYDPLAHVGLVVAYGAGGNADMHGTAVVRVFTGNGFAVAADGLRRDLDGNEILANQQKVFKIEGAAGSAFAFCLTGATYFQNGTASFDVSSELQQIADRLAPKQYDSSFRYIEAFAKALLATFRVGQRDGRIGEFRDFGKGNMIVRVLFAGYYSSKPFMAIIELHRIGQDIQDPAKQFQEFSPNETKIEISGSEAVQQSLLSPDDLTFPEHESKSWKTVRSRRPISVDEAVELAQTYIAACASDAGRKMDADCFSIGGHIHVATITPEKGFAWLIPPIPATSTTPKSLSTSLPLTTHDWSNQLPSQV